MVLLHHGEPILHCFRGRPKPVLDWVCPEVPVNEAVEGSIRLLEDRVAV
jgi:hypothetical protein